MKRKIWLIAISVMLNNGVVRAQDAKQWTLEQCLEYALLFIIARLLPFRLPKRM